MSQTPRRLQRYRSLRDWFGAELRHWRELRALSQERLAARAHFGEDMIAKVEKAERWPSREMAARLDAALGTDGILERMWPLVEAEREKRLGYGEDDGSETEFLATLQRLGTVGESVIYASRGHTEPWKVGRRTGPLARRAVPSLLGAEGSGATGAGGTGGPSTEGLILMDDLDSAHFADQPSNLGPATLEELREATARLAGMFANAPRLEVYLQARTLRERIFRLLDGRQRLSETRDLYFLAGAVLGMLADITEDLGYPGPAMSHARAALLCAREAGHGGLAAWIRGQQAMLAFWDGRPAHAVEFTRTGMQEATTSGTVAVRLSALEARAAGALGDARTVRAALDRASELREAVVPDDLDGFGGLLTFPVAKQHFYAGQAHLGLRDPSATVAAAEACVAGYRGGPPAERALDNESVAQVDLAIAQVLDGELEAAREAAQPAFGIPFELHTNQMDAEMRRLHRELCASPVHDAPVAAELRDQIEFFLSSGPARTPVGE